MREEEEERSERKGEGGKAALGLSVELQLDAAVLW